MARTSTSWLPLPVNITTRVPGARRRISSVPVAPSPSGSPKSSSTTSGWARSTASYAAASVPTTPTTRTSFSSPSAADRPSATIAWSSTISTAISPSGFGIPSKPLSGPMSPPSVVRFPTSLFHHSRQSTKGTRPSREERGSQPGGGNAPEVVFDTVDERDQNALAVLAEQRLFTRDVALLPRHAHLRGDPCDDRARVVAQVAAGLAQQGHPVPGRLGCGRGLGRGRGVGCGRGHGGQATALSPARRRRRPLAQPTLADLPGRPVRQRGDDADRGRALEPGQRARAVGDDVGSSGGPGRGTTKAVTV